LPWLKILTNYFDDNWLCIINIAPRPVLFAHSFRGGKLMTTSSSHGKAQKLISEHGCKLKPMIKNDIFRKTMIPKNMMRE
jgi:hypothetical protein